VTSEQKVKLVYPKAVCLWAAHLHSWGVFFHGGPTPLGPGQQSRPDIYGNSKSNAWVNAVKKLQPQP
jgi:hypothetical protein